MPETGSEGANPPKVEQEKSVDPIEQRQDNNFADSLSQLAIIDPEIAIEDLADSYPMYEAAGGVLPDVNILEKFPKERIEFKNGKVDIRDIKPEFLRESQDVPLIMMCGMAMNSDIIQSNVKTLAKMGEHVKTLDFIGGGDKVEGEKGSSSEINRQAELLYQVLLNTPDKKVDLSSISFSMLTILALNKMHPEIMQEKVRNVVGVFPMLAAEKGVINVLKKFYKEFRRPKGNEDQEQKDINAQVIGMSAEYYKKNPIRAIKEIWAIARQDQYKELENLQKNIGGKIGLIQGEDDLLVSNKGLWKNIGKGSQSAFTQLTAEMMQQDPKFAEKGFKVGDKIYNRNAQNEEPPFTMITMRRASHETSGHSSMASDILHTIDYLNTGEPAGIQPPSMAQAA